MVQNLGTDRELQMSSEHFDVFISEQLDMQAISSSQKFQELQIERIDKI